MWEKWEERGKALKIQEVKQASKEGKGIGLSLSYLLSGLLTPAGWTVLYCSRVEPLFGFADDVFTFACWVRCPLLLPFSWRLHFAHASTAGWWKCEYFYSCLSIEASHEVSRQFYWTSYGQAVRECFVNLIVIVQWFWLHFQFRKGEKKTSLDGSIGFGISQQKWKEEEEEEEEDKAEGRKEEETKGCTSKVPYYCTYVYTVVVVCPATASQSGSKFTALRERVTSRMNVH